MKLKYSMLGILFFSAHAMVEDKQKLHEKALQWKQFKVQHECFTFVALSQKNMCYLSELTCRCRFLGKNRLAIIKREYYYNPNNHEYSFNICRCKYVWKHEYTHPELEHTGYVFNIKNKRLVEASCNLLKHVKAVVNDETEMIAQQCSNYACTLKMPALNNYIVNEKYSHAACISSGGEIIIFSLSSQLRVHEIPRKLCDAYFCFAKID